MLPFASLFSKRVWPHAQRLVAGALLAPGKRTVTAVLRILGLSRDAHFQNHHRVLNRAVWSVRQASRVLLLMLVAAFAPTGPLVFGLDDTIERRRGKCIAAKGVYRDPVRSSHGHFVKATGLRWLCLMLLVEIPWAERVWALPFLSALAPSERYNKERGRRHKALTDWARQMLKQLRRWLPERSIVVVTDSGFAALNLLSCVSSLAHPVYMVTRLRLDAALYEPVAPRKAGQMGRPRCKGVRLPTLGALLDQPSTVWCALVVEGWYGGGPRAVEIATDTAVWYHTGMPSVPIRWVLVRDPLGQFDCQALLSTDLGVSAEQILKWFVRRWRVEVTFEEVRAHLGVESQRQWSDLAIGRTTPVLLGLFSVVTLLAGRLHEGQPLGVRQAAWYAKHLPTFADALADVRKSLWASGTFATSTREQEMVKIPRALLERLTEALCYAA